MVYGLVSQLDDENSFVFFRTKKIPQENIIHRQNLSQLLNRVKSGDTVYCISVNRFNSVNQLGVVARFCMDRDVAMHFMAQPYLDIGNGKHWKRAIVKQIEYIVFLERNAKAHLSKGMRMNDDMWNYLITTLEVMNLEMVAQTFSADGIMR